MIHARPAVTLAAWIAGDQPGHDVAKVVGHPVPRMSRAPALAVIPVGDLVVDTDRMLATSNGVKIKLKGKEY